MCNDTLIISEAPTLLSHIPPPPSAPRTERRFLNLFDGLHNTIHFFYANELWNESPMKMLHELTFRLSFSNLSRGQL